MNAPGRAVRLMRAVSRVHPHFWTTAYQRGRLLGIRPKASPETVTLHITDACPLECSFCFASDAVKIAPLSREEIRGTLEFFRGVSRVIIVGGEPLYYPGLGDVLKECAGRAGEYEIFTNGLALIRNAGAVDDLIAKCAAPVWFTIPLDPYHRAEMGDDFRKVIEAALDLEEREAAGVKFNLADAEFHSEGYLNYKHVREILDGYHTRVRSMFDRLFREGRIGDVFYFNPVVGHGTEAGNVRRSIGAWELLGGVEAVAGRRRGDGRVAVMKHLTALWMERVPDCLVAGYPLEAGADDVILDGLAAGALGFDTAPWVRGVVRWLAGDGEDARREALDALGEGFLESRAAAALNAGDEDAVAALAAVAAGWKMFEGGAAAVRERDLKLAAAAREVALSGQQFPVSVTPRPGARGFSAGAGAAFMDLCGGDADLIGGCASRLAEWAEAAIADGLSPVQCGAKYYFGKMLEDGSGWARMCDARFVWGDVEDESGGPVFAVAPYIVYSRKDGLSVWLDYVDLRKLPGEERAESWRVFTGMLRRALGRAGWKLFRERMTERSLGGLLADDGEWTEGGGVKERDAFRVFDELFFDSRAGEVMWENDELVRLVLDARMEVYSEASVAKLKGEAESRVRLRGGK